MHRRSCNLRLGRHVGHVIRQRKKPCRRTRPVIAVPHQNKLFGYSEILDLAKHVTLPATSPLRADTNSDTEARYDEIEQRGAA